MIFLLTRLLARVVRRPPSMLRVSVLLAAIIAYGATGFMFFEVPDRPALTWSDGFWWTVATLTTVGYGDVAPATAYGRFLVAVPLMVFGIGLLGYVLSLAAAALVESRTRELAGMGTMKLEKHVVIVNMPSIGKFERLLGELLHTTGLGPGTDVVLIDEELPQLPAELAARNVHFVRGNPARDETLARAAIDRAAYAIVLSRRPGDPHSDDQVIAVVLAIEARSPKIRSVVECVDPSGEELLRKAGCDSIVCTARFDSHFIVSELLNPGAQEVVDQLLSTVRGGQQLFMTPVRGSGARYGELAKTCAQRGHVAIGVRRAGALRLNAPSDHMLVEGDLVVTIGAEGLDLHSS